MAIIRLTVVTGCVALGVLHAIVPTASGSEGPDAWALVYTEDFSDDSWRNAWRLDGYAELSTEAEGPTGYLRIQTLPSPVNTRDKASVLWLGRRFDGDLRIEFRARGEAGNRALFYFNANPGASSGYRGLFDWARPDAKMLRYAGTGLMELYSVGILRNDQAVCNLRYLGGDAMSKIFVAQRPVFEKVSAIASFDSPYAGRPADTWFEHELEIRDNRIVLSVDGQRLVEHLDTGTVELPDCRWEPLTEGGSIAFRNFRATTVCLDYVRVYQSQENAEGKSP